MYRIWTKDVYQFVVHEFRQWYEKFGTHLSMYKPVQKPKFIFSIWLGCLSHVSQTITWICILNNHHLGVDTTYFQHFYDQIRAVYCVEMAMMMENFRPKKSREGFSLPQGGHHCSKNGDTWGGPDQLLFQKKKCICKKNWNGGKNICAAFEGSFCHCQWMKWWMKNAFGACNFRKRQ